MKDLRDVAHDLLRRDLLQQEAAHAFLLAKGEVDAEPFVQMTSDGHEYGFILRSGKKVWVSDILKEAKGSDDVGSDA